jgi:hypothetical protein
LGKSDGFKKFKRVVFLSRAEEQKPLSVFSMELQAERIKDIFKAYFSIFSIFRFSPNLAGAVTAR